MMICTTESAKKNFLVNKVKSYQVRPGFCCLFIIHFIKCQRCWLAENVKRHFVVFLCDAGMIMSGNQPVTWPSHTLEITGWRAGVQSLIARFMGPSWGPSGAVMTQLGPMLALWTLLSGIDNGLIDTETKSLHSSLIIRLRLLQYLPSDIHHCRA